MDKTRETPAMKLARRVLADRNINLREMIAKGREVDPETHEPRKTWDDLAFEIRTEMTAAGEEMRLVRETVINWATRYGVVEPRDAEPRETEPVGAGE